MYENRQILLLFAFLVESRDHIRGMIVVQKFTLFKQIVRALFFCTRVWGLFMVIQCVNVPAL